MCLNTKTILFASAAFFAMLYLASAVGRNPTAVEHNACRVKWSEQVNMVKATYKDDRARVVAFNVSTQCPVAK